jgi:hypothetical protein
VPLFLIGRSFAEQLELTAARRPSLSADVIVEVDRLGPDAVL